MTKMESCSRKISITDSVIDYSRQADIINQSDLDVVVYLIGVGGIGSPTARTLSKMGIANIIAFDDDTVESHNIPNQMYRKSDIGKAKVDAIKEICEDYSDVNFQGENKRFDLRVNQRSIVISGVDSMSSRKEIWNLVKLNPSVLMYLDGRMGKEMIKLYKVNPVNMDSIKNYELSLHNDEDAEPIRCTEKAIIYTGEAVASLICHAVRCFLTKRDTPYKRSTFLDFSSGMWIHDSDI